MTSAGLTWLCSTWSFMLWCLSLALLVVMSKVPREGAQARKTSWSLDLELAHSTSAFFYWPKQGSGPTPESEWEESSELADKGKGHIEAVNWRHKQSASFHSLLYQTLDLGEVLCVCVCACSVMSDSLWPLWTVAQEASLSTGVGCHFFLQGIFLTQG